MTAITSILAYVWLYIWLEVWDAGIINIAEALITFGFFLILIVIAFIADKIIQYCDKKKRKKLAQFNVEDFYVILNAKKNSKKGPENPTVENEDAKTKNNKEIQKYLKQKFNNYKIEDIQIQDIEEVLLPKSVVNERLQYRKNISNMISGRQKIDIFKGQEDIEELNEAEDQFLKHELNPKIGFRWLHYSVTESYGIVKVVIEKKNEEDDINFGIRTVDGTATAGIDDELGDYQALDQIMNMGPGVSQNSVNIKIIDDEGIEPDEEFFVELYDPATKQRLPGEDTRTKVTILDDDKPGIFGFEYRTAKIRSKDEKIRLRVIRKDGCDDEVLLNYKTFEPENMPNKAEPSIDYKPWEGQLSFETGETMKVIEVAILPREDKDSTDRDDAFGVKIYDPKFSLEHKNNTDGIEKPKLGKRNECIVQIVGDEELIQRNNGIEDLLEEMRQKNSVSWAMQFKYAWMLSPQLDENNNIIEVTAIEAILHFCTIGWKLLFACVPPARYCRGWISFFVSLCFIGLIMAIVSEVATLFGCVVGLKQAATAIIFVAIGTSLPDTFASKQAAEQSNYADAAIGNITGANNINIFLGLGIPWIIGAVYGLAKGEDYKINKSDLSFSVILFLITSTITLIILLLRRWIIGGELGGKNGFVKWLSACILLFLWFIYILFSCLRIYDNI